MKAAEAQRDIGNYSNDRERIEAFYFGAKNGPALFGCYHDSLTAPDRSRSAVGVLICNPFGFEEVAGHRGFRQLAIDCAAEGFPCLRFDYLGCGNSHLDEYEEPQIDCWLESINQAATVLKQKSGVQQIVCIGFRLGAALAVLASVQRNDVCGLIAVSPVVQGKRFLRELRLKSTSRAETSYNDSRGVVLEPNGFPLTAATCEAIERINLPSVSVHGKRLLIIDAPNEESVSKPWITRLLAQGNEVEQSTIPGYDELIDDPQTSVVPLDLFDSLTGALVGWSNEAVIPSTHIKDWQDSGSTVTSSSVCIFGSHIVFDPMRSSMGAQSSRGLGGGMVACDTEISESIVSIPSCEQNLFGVISQPNTDKIIHNIILLNSGKVRNIGPNRFWVSLSRAWAACGFRVLRLDLSGIGESPGLDGIQANVSYASSGTREIAAAAEYLRAMDNTEVHLVGLCSGGYQALRAATEGLPIRSATLINPLAFDSLDLVDEAKESIANYEILDLSQRYREEIVTKAFWNKLVHGRLDFVTIRKVAQQRLRFSFQLNVQKLMRVISPRSVSNLASEFECVLERGVLLNLVFAEGDPGYKLLRRKTAGHLDKLLRGRGFKIVLISDADHTFIQLDSRHRLSDTLNQFSFLVDENQSGTSKNDG